MTSPDPQPTPDAPATAGVLIPRADLEHIAFALDLEHQGHLNRDWCNTCKAQRLAKAALVAEARRARAAKATPVGGLAATWRARAIMRADAGQEQASVVYDRCADELEAALPAPAALEATPVSLSQTCAEFLEEHLYVSPDGTVTIPDPNAFDTDFTQFVEGIVHAAKAALAPADAQAAAEAFVRKAYADGFLDVDFEPTGNDELTESLAAAFTAFRAQASQPGSVGVLVLEQLVASLGEMRLDPERYRKPGDTSGVSYAEGWNTALEDISRLIGYRIEAALDRSEGQGGES